MGPGLRVVVRRDPIAMGFVGFWVLVRICIVREVLCVPEILRLLDHGMFNSRVLLAITYTPQSVQQFTASPHSRGPHLARKLTMPGNIPSHKPVV